MKTERAPLNPNFVRLLIIGAAFLTVTLVLILMQPSNPSTAATPEELAQPQIMAEDDTVTRANTALIDPVLPATAEAQPVADATSAAVLASLAATTAPAPQTAVVQGEADALRNLTSGVLASLSGKSPAAAAAAPQSMEQLVVQALQQGQSDAYIDALINEAAAAGSIEVPGSLRTNAGRVDTGTLLADLVRKSNPSAAAVDIPAPEGKGVEVRVVQRAGETVKYNFYTVQSGDSLGAIAQKFYGDAALYSAIFDANRQILSSPDLVRTGQRLSIPEVSSG